MYVIKTNSADTASVVLKYPASGTHTKTVHTSARDMGHGNGMTTNGTSLFVAAGGGASNTNRMIKIKGSGSGQTVTTYTGTFGFLSIAYKGSNDFIVKNGGDNEYIRYRRMSV